MFGLGMTHLLVIFVVALVVFGPEELPKVMRSAGAMMKTFNRIAGDFRKQFDDAIHQAEKELDLQETRSMLQNAMEDVPRSADKAIVGKDSNLNPAAERGAESELTSVTAKDARFNAETSSNQ
ncbi:Sec-independent protein translocase protein TatB [Mesorhizobium sp. M0019]|uniref:Sec-independent protein translocase protein TatB n=1 Tax=unclassified Mesorhizobium TaxID=325217 RepID=UPI003336D33E